MLFLNSDTRKISPHVCIDTPSDRRQSLRLDVDRALFIVRKNFSSVAGSRLLGQLWLVMDPVIQAGIYFFVLVVLRAREDPQSLLIGITYVRILQLGLRKGFVSSIDFSGGIKIERVRTRVFLFAEGMLSLTNTFFSMIGVLLGFYLFFGTSILDLFQIFILAFFLYLFWYLLGFFFSPVGVIVPDTVPVVSYFGMLMFFASPAIYTLGQTSGAHRQLSLINPFSYFVEAARAIILGSEDYKLLSEELGAIFSLIFIFLLVLNVLRFDKLRWRFSRWP